MTLAIETVGLGKSYPVSRGITAYFSRNIPQKWVVNSVDLAVQPGELFGLLGPNGAGKTTLIKLLTTLVIPSAGFARVNGYDLRHDRAIKASVGLVTSDERSFYWRLTGQQNLDFFASLHGLNGSLRDDRVTEALAAVDLTAVANQRFQTYSTGMRQRLAIARSLLNQPRLLFLDEPTKGLDPTAAARLHHLVRDRLTGEMGITVFLTTHDLHEAEHLCDRIAIMSHGCLQACGTIDELRSDLQIARKFIIQAVGLQRSVIEDLPARFPQVSVAAQAHITELYDRSDLHPAIDISTPDVDIANRLIDHLRQENGTIKSVVEQTHTIQKIYQHHTTTPTPGSPAGGRPRSDTLDEPLAAANAAKIKLNLPLMLAFLRRDFLTEISYPVAFILQIGGIFLSVGVFYFIGQMLGPGVSPMLAAYGGDYFSFVLIGIAFSSYFSVGLSSFAGSLRQAQTTGTLEAMLASPASISAIIIASSLWDYILTTIRVLVYLGLGMFLIQGTLGESNYPLAFLILLLTITSFSSIGIIGASFVMVLKRGDPIAWVFGAISNFLGGVYYPIAVLPGWLQFLAAFLPITYALDAMRLALINGASFMDVADRLVILLLFGVVLAPVSLLSFKVAVRRARIDGSLTHY